MILNPLKYQLKYIIILSLILYFFYYFYLLLFYSPLKSFIDKLRFVKSKSEMNVIKAGSEILSESFLETMQKVNIIFILLSILIFFL